MSSSVLVKNFVERMLEKNLSVNNIDIVQKYPKLIAQIVDKPYKFTFQMIYSVFKKFESNKEAVDRKKIYIKSNLIFHCTNYEVEKITIHDNKINIYVNFMNVLGLQGALTGYHQNIIKQLHNNDINEFFNIFNHRFTEIYYEIDNKKSFEIKDLNILDMGLKSLSGSLSRYSYKDVQKKDNIKKFNAYDFFEKHKNKDGLQRIVSKSFGCFAEVLDLQPRRVDMSESQFILGRKNLGSAILGRSIVVHDQINIILHVSLQDLYKFLPNHCSMNFQHVLDVVESYLESQYFFKIFFKITKADFKSNSVLLGWTSFLGGNSELEQKGDLISINDLIYYVRNNNTF